MKARLASRKSAARQATTIEENTMTVQPPSVPPTVPRLNEDEPGIERENDIPSNDNRAVDETTSSQDGSSRDIERENDISSDDNAPVDETSSSRHGLSRDIERK